MVKGKFANDVRHIRDYLYIDERTSYRFSNGYRRFLPVICAHLFQRETKNSRSEKREKRKKNILRTARTK